MAITYEAPTVTPDESSARSDSKKYTHPAYGVIGISRAGWNGGGVQLFGSSIRHNNTIRLCIKTAERSSNDNYEFIHGNKTLIEVELSGTQLGDLLTSMNQGDGVPCTIRRREENWNIPFIKDQETPISESTQAMKDQVTAVMKRADGMIVKAKEMLDTKTINKTQMKELMDSLDMLRQEIRSNLPFVTDCFDRKVEKTITQAKGEVEAFVSSTIRNAGLEAIANGQYKIGLPYDEIIIDKKLEIE